MIDLVHMMDYFRMMIVVNIHEAKTHFSKLVDRAHGGEEVVVAKAGRPWARLVPLETKKERVPGRYNDSPETSFFDPLSPHELQAWEQ
ncbi:type II toxin-antitoxin system Phd/YefM family antitoxin [Spirochaeta dissipatitropha]